MRKRIKAFGEVMMRLEVPNYRTLTQTNTLDISYSGTGVNVLSALSQYGHDTAMITKLPNNSVGDAAIAHLRRLGIHTEDIVRGGDFIGQYFLEKGFSVRPSKVTYGERKSSSFCTSEFADYDVDSLLKDVDVLHFCGIVLAISEQTRNLAIAIARRAKQLGIHLVFDCNYRPKLWEKQDVEPRSFYETILHEVDSCFMTEKDAQFILGTEARDEATKQQLETLLPIVKEKFSLEMIAGTIRNQTTEITQAIQGYVYRGELFHYSNEYIFEIFDRVGAGDGFSSGIIHGWLTNMSTNEIVEFATAASVLAHTTYGDSPISTIDDIWNVVKNSGRSQLER